MSISELHKGKTDNVIQQIIVGYNSLSAFIKQKFSLEIAHIKREIIDRDNTKFI